MEFRFDESNPGALHESSRKSKSALLMRGSFKSGPVV
jgi:hypothetical protein